MVPSIKAKTVELFGGLYPDGDVVKRVRIDSIGEPPNMTVKMYQYLMAEGRYVEIDRLTGATVIGNVDSEQFTIEGASDQLVHEVGLPAADAVVRWLVKQGRCASC